MKTLQIPRSTYDQAVEALQTAPTALIEGFVFSLSHGRVLARSQGREWVQSPWFGYENLASWVHTIIFKQRCPLEEAVAKALPGTLEDLADRLDLDLDLDLDLRILHRCLLDLEVSEDRSLEYLNPVFKLPAQPIPQEVAA